MYWADSRSQAVRQGDWKLINFGNEPDKERTELYNLATDPNETKEVSARHPDVVAKLRAELAQQKSRDVP